MNTRVLYLVCIYGSMTRIMRSTYLLTASPEQGRNDPQATSRNSILRSYVLSVLFFVIVFFSSFIILVLIFSLSLSTVIVVTQIRGHKADPPPLPTTVLSFVFIARRLEPCFPSSPDAASDGRFLRETIVNRTKYCL